MEKRNGLLLRFALIFFAFMVVTLVISTVAIYNNQRYNYTNEQELRVKEVTRCLAGLIEADGEEFLLMQEYFLANHEKIIIPYDFDGDYSGAQKEWEELFASLYPGETLGQSVRFEELPEEAKILFTTYKYEMWLNTFERFNEEYGTEYVYYLVPTDTPPDMFYVFDGLRTEKVVDGVSIMEFDYDVEVPEEDYPKLWETCRTGKSPDGYDSYDNQYGRTYGYYTPLYIDGKFRGVVCADINVDLVHQGIALTTLQVLLLLAGILFVCTVFTLFLIDRHYISRLRRMKEYMNEYAESKDVDMADKFEALGEGGHEISNLSLKTASMIRELQDYMEDLSKTTHELDDTKQHAAEMSALAHRDSLTGIRNKMAYDKVVEKLEKELDANPDLEFGFAMIDLNFLKMINDTYGHESGNMAIKTLCVIVCDIFDHSPVFRIGGDEFVVILKGNDYKNRDALIKKFRNVMEEMNLSEDAEPWKKISAAIGVAIYTPDIDDGPESVFIRADSLMYENKKSMKATRE